MTTRTIVNQLLNQGYDITYYVRKDGGILIKSINGQKFTGAQGNKVARQMVGATLSEKKQEQLKSATKKRTSFSEQYGREFYNKYKKIATKWRKAKLPSSAGKVSLKKLRKQIKEEGLEAAFKALSEKEKYASGIAYYKNVEALSVSIKQVGEYLDHSGYIQLANDLIANADRIKESSIQPAYQELYRLSSEPLTNGLIEEVLRNVRAILEL